MDRIEKVRRQPQCNHKEVGCANMEKQPGRDYGRCLLRNPFDCSFEPKPEEGRLLPPKSARTINYITVKECQARIEALIEWVKPYLKRDYNISSYTEGNKTLEYVISDNDGDVLDLPPFKMEG